MLKLYAYKRMKNARQQLQIHLRNSRPHREVYPGKRKSVTTSLRKWGSTRIPSASGCATFYADMNEIILIMINCLFFTLIPEQTFHT